MNVFEFVTNLSYITKPKMEGILDRTIKLTNSKLSKQQRDDSKTGWSSFLTSLAGNVKISNRYGNAMKCYVKVEHGFAATRL